VSLVNTRHKAIGGLIVLLLTSCFAVAASAAEAPLVFKRTDGSAIRFAGTPRAWCGPWDEEVARRSVHVSLRGAKRGWELSAVRRDIKVGRPIEFPNEFVYTRPRRAQVFVYDAAIEASSAEEESSGSMVFSRLNCKLGGVVEFSIDAILGSEFSDGEPVQVSGTYRGRVSKRP
jgi:hypothetical protein